LQQQLKDERRNRESAESERDRFKQKLEAAKPTMREALLDALSAVNERGAWDNIKCNKRKRDSALGRFRVAGNELIELATPPPPPKMTPAELKALDQLYPTTKH
jgi:hypothetical protein